MGPETTFMDVLGKVEERTCEVMEQIQSVRRCCLERDMRMAYARAGKLEERAEKLVLLARALPAYTGAVRAREDMERTMEECIPVELGFTEQGWFCLRIPMLLPKKEKGSADYIRSILYPAMQRFFQGKEPVRYRKCVLAYRHIYRRDAPERGRRDHDNIETNMVTDIVAMYVMPDDSPGICSHFECSREGNQERTEVYVIREEDFVSWLSAEKSLSGLGIRLYEKPWESSEKDM